MMQQKALLQFDMPLTDDDILFVLAQNEFFTRKMIADRLGRAKSPTLVARLNRMASEGLFDVQYHKLPNGVDMWVYSPTQAGQKAIREARQRAEEQAADAFGS